MNTNEEKLYRLSKDIILGGNALAESLSVDVPCEQRPDTLFLKIQWQCRNPECGSRDVTIDIPQQLHSKPMRCPVCIQTLHFGTWLTSQVYVPSGHPKIETLDAFEDSLIRERKELENPATEAIKLSEKS